VIALKNNCVAWAVLYYFACRYYNFFGQEMSRAGAKSKQMLVHWTFIVARKANHNKMYRTHSKHLFILRRTGFVWIISIIYGRICEIFISLLGSGSLSYYWGLSANLVTVFIGLINRLLYNCLLYWCNATVRTAGDMKSGWLDGDIGTTV